VYKHAIFALDGEIHKSARDFLLTIRRDLFYVGRLKSNAHMLVEREQKQIARSGKKHMKVQCIGRTTCVSFFSEGFVQNIFHSAKYFTSFD
jgi:hypothetical protein